jgi:hypothetical protein
MPHLSPADIRKVQEEEVNDELVTVSSTPQPQPVASPQPTAPGAPQHPGRVTIHVPANNAWRAPRLNLQAALAIRHREAVLKRSMTPDEQTEYLKELCK